MVLVNAQDRQIELTGRTNPNNTMSITWRTPMVGDISHKISQELQKWERGKQRHKREHCEGEAFFRLFRNGKEEEGSNMLL